MSGKPARSWGEVAHGKGASRWPGLLGVLGCAALLGWTATAFAEADGPDAWRVTGVPPGDVLNIRMGPGTEYPVTGGFQRDARGLSAITCVPLVTPPQYMAMSPSERENLPPRWCLVSNEDGLEGWVSGAYLAEDTLPEARPSAATMARAPLEERALDVVTELYRAHARAPRDGGADPLHRRPEDYFFADIAEDMRANGVQADPLFGGQDADITNLQIGLDPERPMLRGMVTVVARFRNFGRDQSAVVRLRADPEQGGAPRIFRIEHEGWSFP